MYPHICSKVKVFTFKVSFKQATAFQVSDIAMIGKRSYDLKFNNFFFDQGQGHVPGSAIRSFGGGAQNKSGRTVVYSDHFAMCRL